MTEQDLADNFARLLSSSKSVFELPSSEHCAVWCCAESTAVR